MAEGRIFAPGAPDMANVGLRTTALFEAAKSVALLAAGR